MIYKQEQFEQMRMRIASEALAGMLSNPNWSENDVVPNPERSDKCSLVELSVVYADALLEELKIRPYNEKESTRTVREEKYEN